MEKMRIKFYIELNGIFEPDYFKDTPWWGSCRCNGNDLLYFEKDVQKSIHELNKRMGYKNNLADDFIPKKAKDIKSKVMSLHITAEEYNSDLCLCFTAQFSQTPDRWDLENMQIIIKNELKKTWVDLIDELQIWPSSGTLKLSLNFNNEIKIHQVEVENVPKLKRPRLKLQLNTIGDVEALEGKAVRILKRTSPQTAIKLSAELIPISDFAVALEIVQKYVDVELLPEPDLIATLKILNIKPDEWLNKTSCAPNRSNTKLKEGKCL